MAQSPWFGFPAVVEQLLTQVMSKVRGGSLCFHGRDMQVRSTQPYDAGSDREVGDDRLG
jgi:hypothetical protein